jgi:hypothetical protein
MSTENGLSVTESSVETENGEEIQRFIDELELGQLESMEGAARRLFEVITALLALVFAAIAFGADFPPAYVRAGPIGPMLLLIILVLFLLAMSLAWSCQRPLLYSRFRDDPSGMRAALDKAERRKIRGLRWAGRIFWLGSIALAVLVMYSVAL